MAQWTTTYTALAALVGTYCEDASTELSDAMSGIINRAEERVLTDLDIDYFDDVRSVSTANGVATVAKTSDMITIQSIRLTATNEFILRRGRDFVKMYGGSGSPLYYFDDDTDITMAPTPNSTYALEVKYLSRPTPLSPSNQTNWIASNTATLLLYASLKEAEHFLLAPERVAEFDDAYGKALGPARALWRVDQGPAYEPVGPAAEPAKVR